ncbi:MAG: glycosyltransferase [Bacteroidales bacterium]|jgi:glycosyltransferase involved in cell wall biosynthesis|nr:glycosyltransferase [Bacteroidales bacterium]MDD4672038.1 glycosyltransferase [Bacteroidales bacterium]MDY0347621.1 glycosyltransferase [Tenuifilaceae bacterium]
MCIFQVAFGAICLLYFTIIALFALGLFFKQKHGVKPSLSIPISIVVAVRNEEQVIDRLLRSIFGQHYPLQRFELVLINDHSDDATSDIVTQWAKQYPNISLVQLPADLAGKKQAVALGIKLAKNDIIVLTDADCTHPKDWLRTISSQYKALKVDMLIGPVMISTGNSIFSNIQALEHASLTASSIGACGLGIPFMASSANLSFSKSRLGFDVQMLNPNQASGDDVFLLHSAKRKKDFKISSLTGKDGLVFTQPAKNVKAFFNQRARWASKSTKYTDFTAISVGFIVLLFNLMLVCLMFLSLWNPIYLKMLAVGFVVKSVADILMLFPYLKRYHKLSLLNVFVLLQLIYPIYIVVAFGMAIFTSNTWKGRSGNGNK